MFAALKILLPKNADAGIDALVAGERIYVANGITTAQDGRVMPESWPALEAAAKRGALPIDTVALVSFERDWPKRQGGWQSYVGRFGSPESS
ncbi:MAG: hypothetical protein IPP45_10080 [Sphingomonadales bacterium]|nr:hypothetical protein [Sphingomonadales bacterium]